MLHDNQLMKGGRDDALSSSASALLGSPVVAPSIKGFSKKWETILLLTSGIIVVYTLRVNISVAGQAMRSTLHWNETEKGYILSAFYWGYALGQVPASTIISRYGGKWLFGFSVVAPSVLTLMVPAACNVSFSAACIMRLFIGLFESATFPCVYHFFAIWVPIKEKTFLIPLIVAAQYVGVIIGFLVSGVLLESDFQFLGQNYSGWPVVFYFFGLLGMLWFPFYSFFMYESPDVHPYISQQERLYINYGKKSRNNINLMSSTDEKMGAFADPNEGVLLMDMSNSNSSTDRIIAPPYITENPYSNTSIHSINSDGLCQRSGHSNSNAALYTTNMNDAETNDNDNDSRMGALESMPLLGSSASAVQTAMESGGISMLSPPYSGSGISSSSSNVGDHLVTTNMEHQYNDNHHHHHHHHLNERVSSIDSLKGTTATTSSTVALLCSNSVVGSVSGLLPNIISAGTADTTFGGGTGTVSSTSTGSAPLDEPQQIPWRLFFTHPVAITLLINNFTFGWTGFLLLSEIPAYLQDELGFSLENSAELSIPPFIAILVSCIGFGKFFEHLQTQRGWKTRSVRQWAEFIGFGGSALGLLMMGFLKNKYYSYATMIATQFMLGAVHSGLACAYSDVAPNFSSPLNSLGNMCGAIAGIFGPIAVGYFTTLWPGDNGMDGWRMVFYTTCFFSSIALYAWHSYQTSDIVDDLNEPPVYVEKLRTGKRS